MHPYPATLWRFTLIFVLFALSIGKKVVANSLKEMWPVFQGCLIHIDLQDGSQFDS